MSKITNGIRVLRGAKKVWDHLFVGRVSTGENNTLSRQKVYPRPANHLQIMGLPVRDKVTKFRGIASSVCYDLYGCIQVCITPEVDQAGKRGDQVWFDVTRLEVLGDKPVVELPDYSKGYVAEGRKGAAEKPAMTPQLPS